MKRHIRSTLCDMTRRNEACHTISYVTHMNVTFQILCGMPHWDESCHTEWHDSSNMSYKRMWRFICCAACLIHLCDIWGESCHSVTLRDMTRLNEACHTIFEIRHIHLCDSGDFQEKNVFRRRKNRILPLRCGSLNASPKVVHRPRSESPLHFDIRNI